MYSEWHHFKSASFGLYVHESDASSKKQQSLASLEMCLDVATWIRDCLSDILPREEE